MLWTRERLQIPWNAGKICVTRFVALSAGRGVRLCNNHAFGGHKVKTVLLSSKTIVALNEYRGRRLYEYTHAQHRRWGESLPCGTGTGTGTGTPICNMCFGGRSLLHVKLGSCLGTQ